MNNTNSAIENSNSFNQKLPFWGIPIFIGLIIACPFLYACVHEGSHVLFRVMASDSYHYLAIARKAMQYNMFTYDGLTVTNGFHPLWQYCLRAVFYIFDLKTHSQQAVTAMSISLAAMTIGSILTSAAIIRFTNQKYLGLLVAPGVFYLAIGVHSECLSIWHSFDGMESAFSVLFGGIFYFLLSKHIKQFSNQQFDFLKVSQIIGLTIPFIILSRLDDVYIIPAFLIGILLYQTGNKEKLTAGAWICVPTGVILIIYLIYNYVTVGSPMPLSGSTKAGFVGFMTLYLTSVVHFPPISDLKNLLVAKQSNPWQIFANRFRFVEMLYPMLIGITGVWVLIERRITSGVVFLALSICTYIIIKTGYNFLFVHPWHQSDWYYHFMSLSLTVLGALALNHVLRPVVLPKPARKGLLIVYGLLLLFLSSSVYYRTVYASATMKELKFWEKKDFISAKLKENNVTGLINVDDGISAFLLDFPDMHGFAFAADVESQKAYREGKMLTLALSRGINTITGFEYLPPMNTLPQSESELTEYLKNSLAWDTMFGEADRFKFTLIYYDPDIKIPFISFQPR